VSAGYWRKGSDRTFSVQYCNIMDTSASIDLCGIGDISPVCLMADMRSPVNSPDPTEREFVWL
jgi:hypothetical protein